MLAIKPLFLLVAWLAGVTLACLVAAVMLAPYLGSVISNIGRRPVILQPVRATSCIVRERGLTN
jgi:hypothetical protein